MMNNTNPDRKVTVSKSAPWTVSIDGKPMPTHFASRTLAREAAADFRKNGVPEQHSGTVDVKARRRELGLSRSDVAGKLGVSVYHLDRIEAGKLEVPTALVDTLASL